MNSIFRAALAALQRPVAALLPFFAVMHSLRVLALAGEVLLTTGGHRAVITSRELGTCCIQLAVHQWLHDTVLFQWWVPPLVGVLPTSCN